MPRFWSLICFGLLFVAGLWPLVAAAAELPSADEILKIHRANRERLSTLHLQLVQIYETTAAHCRLAQWQADQMEQFQKMASQAKPGEIELTVNGKKLSGDEAKEILEELDFGEQQEHIEALRAQSKPLVTREPMEFFLRGDDYQFRRPLKPPGGEDQAQAWRFPVAPLTAESLLTTYRELSIFSRSARSTPAARWWHHSAAGPAYVMQKQICDVMGLSLPPYTAAVRPGWSERHPIDAIFSRPADDYRVLRQETIDGRLLTVVEVGVPFHEDSPSDPQANLLAYRAWLDLERGAIPLRVEHAQFTPEFLREAKHSWQPSEVTASERVVELSGGAFYPAKTVLEHWQPDAGAEPLSQEQWAEVAAGKRKSPLVVHWRKVWDCSLVELKADLDEAFFVLPFPAGQTIVDHDNE